MKLNLSKKPTAALTLFEVLIVVAIVMVLAAVLLPTLSPQRNRYSKKIGCANNLKQLGLAYRIWEGDNNDKMPMQISITNGGAMELIATGNVIAVFQVMSNELSIPRVIFCPEDARRISATNFTTGFTAKNISYFVGLDANDSQPQMFLSGDDHFALASVPVKSGFLDLPTNAPVSWTGARHKFTGNIGLADGSVQQWTTPGLRRGLQDSGVTNRLALP